MISSIPSIHEKLSQAREPIEAWLQKQWKKIRPPIYTSVDLRDSGYKLTSVDTNLFPAGFNNLAAFDKQQAPKAARYSIHQWVPTCQKILIITENHTRNLYYLEHLAHLRTILVEAGFAVKLASLSNVAQQLTSPSGQLITLDSLERKSNYLQAGNFVPDCILLNNDLAEGILDLLSGIIQPIFPSPQFGWHQRLKSNYFQYYQKVCETLALMLQWDPWWLHPLYTQCEDVDFKQGTGHETLITKTQGLLDQIQEKYNTYDIQQKPYVVIKADSGSYGMGVLAIENIEALNQLSRKKRNHMLKTKGNQIIDRVIIQEGIPTLTRYQEKVAEPVIYLMGGQVIGGFHRTHSTRTAQENLNSPGMELTPILFGKPLVNQDTALNNAHEKHLTSYRIMAQLATLAAAIEINNNVDILATE